MNAVDNRCAIHIGREEGGSQETLSTQTSIFGKDLGKDRFGRSALHGRGPTGLVSTITTYCDRKPCSADILDLPSAHA